MNKPTSETPRVDGYLHSLYAGQIAISRQTMQEEGLQESDVESQPPTPWTPEQETLLSHMAQCIAAARRAEQEGKEEAVLPLLRAFMDAYRQFLQSLREKHQDRP